MPLIIVETFLRWIKMQLECWVVIRGNSKCKPNKGVVTRKRFIARNEL